MNEIILNFINNQDGVKENLELAKFYFQNKQLSAAITHFLRAAENSGTLDFDLRYECLMMIALCYDLMGNRWKGVSQYCKFARAECPDRSEAYYLQAKSLKEELEYKGIYEQYDWVTVYEYSRTGLMYQKSMPRPISVIFEGEDHLTALYCLSMLRLNKHRELSAFLDSFELEDKKSLPIFIYIYNELRKWNKYTGYSKDRPTGFNFKGIEKITQNYSQAMQDMFVLQTLNGKTNGTYLEIGSADPEYGSNSKLLEELGWKGLSIDYDEFFVRDFVVHRKNPCFKLDALNIDYQSLIESVLGDVTEIDYLSLDIDPSTNTLECLYRLPLDKIKFNIITFEHDSYCSGTAVQDAAYEYLTKLGYERVCKDVTHNTIDPFEDWYIHGSILSRD